MNQEFTNEIDNDIFFKEDNNLNKIVNSSIVFQCRCEECSNSYISKIKLNQCVICGSNNIRVEECNGNLDNLLVIPFSKTLDDALKSYKKKVIFNPVVPFIFKNKNVIMGMKKLYVRDKIVSLKVSGEVTFLAKDNGSNSKYKVVLDSNFDYQNIVVNNIFGVKDSLFDSINDYDLSKISNFNINDLENDFLINNQSKEDRDKISSNALKCSLKVMSDSIRHDSRRVENNGLNISSYIEREVLLPVYILSIKYKNKNYYYLMNGSNGSDIIEFLLGKLEVTLIAIGLFVMIFLVAFLITYFL